MSGSGTGRGSATGLDNIYPVEITPPDLTPYAKGNNGIPYIWTWDSGQPGPHVAVTALVHGNEPCGAVTLDWLMRDELRPAQGRLSLGFINIAAYEAFDPEEPDATRWIDEDFNRLWAPGRLDDGVRETAEVMRAREIRPWLDTVDLLLDIHSMQHKTEPLTIAGWQKRSAELARRMGTPPVIVADQGHAEGMRMRDYAGFSEDGSDKTAVLIECGQHWESASVDVAKAATTGFLRATGVVAPDWGDLPAAPAPELLQVTEAVTIETENFRFAEDWRGFERLAKGTLIGTDGRREVRAPHEPTVLIMPSRRLWPGKTAVRLAHPVPAGA
ncbi:MAG: succinylglutamate desuccinylase/aspartoacylase family protein [Paracoccus sp. (in: a-proteobacteria)]|nr:succinylglutamate desuccinylase/aspartoacylase family protein [Paracoccus sp. (in: a-proteobacteria)]